MKKIQYRYAEQLDDSYNWELDSLTDDELDLILEVLDSL